MKTMNNLKVFDNQEHKHITGYEFERFLQSNNISMKELTDLMSNRFVPSMGSKKDILYILLNYAYGQGVKSVITNREEQVWS